MCCPGGQPYLPLPLFFCFLYSETKTYKVLKVADGDTITVSEIKNKDTKPQPFMEPQE